MFDWNDDELTNIIWDEAEDGDNHIVSYPAASESYSRKRERSHEASNSKVEEQKVPASEVSIHGRELESTSHFINSEGTSTSGYYMDPWVDISLAKSAKTNQDSLETSGSSLSEITKFDSSGEAAEPDKDLEIYQNPDGSEERAGFIDYSWADIGSFDDLDRIFSNDDSVFGNANLGNPDELWCSSKEVLSSPEKSFPLATESPSLKLGGSEGTSELYGVKTGYAQEEQQFSRGYAGASDDTTSAPQIAHGIGKSAEYCGGENDVTANEQTKFKGQGRDPAVNSQLTVEKSAIPNKVMDKVHKQKKNFKVRKKIPRKSELNSCSNACHNWNTSGDPSGQFKDLVAPPIVQSSPALILRQQSQLGASESMQYQQMQISSPFVASSGYGNANLTNTCSTMPVLSHAQSVESKHQSFLPGNDVSKNQSMTNFTGTTVKGKPMTSQEKIEKLRRRQQMRAMLAIQKQQQQFVNHQIPCGDHSISKSVWEETQVQYSSGGAHLVGVEGPSSLSTFGLGSPLEQDDSSMVSLSVNDYGTEESTLFQLEDIIEKLDVGIRLCIRDSLFRLSQSAMQRHSANDTRCTSINCKDKVAVKRQATSGDNRNTMIPEEETKTNPIDRIVAHLLFHRPRELPGKLPDTVESPPISSKIPQECKGVSEEEQMSFLPETPRDDQQNFSGSKTSCV